MSAASADSRETEADTAAETACRLARIFAELEAIDFDREVPTMSTYEATAIPARVNEARYAVKGEQ